MAAFGDEFPNDLQIEKVDGDGKSDTYQKSRSLVFRITRKSQKSLGNQDATSVDSKSSTSPKTQKDSEHNLKNLKIRIPRSAILSSEINPNDSSISQENSQDELKENSANSVTLKKSKPTMPSSVVRLPELRRTSRRIILRVQKEMVMNSQAGVKEEKQKLPNDENNKHTEEVKRLSSAKENPTNAAKPGRKKRGRTVTGVPLLKERRIGRVGRLSRVRASSNPVFEMKRKSPRGAGAKTVNWPKFDTKSSTVWTLVPKTLFESEFFRKHVVNMHYSVADSKKFRGKNIVFPSRPKRISFPAAREVSELKFKNPSENQANFSHPKRTTQSKGSTRPTVIYFKTRSSPKFAPDISSAHNVDDGSNIELVNTSDCGENQLHNLSYPINNYHNFNDINFDYVYGRKLLVPEPNVYPVLQGLQIQSPRHTVRILEMDRYNPGAQDVINCKFDGYEHEVSSIENVDTLSRSIIVDSMRILYDEEAVLK